MTVVHYVCLDKGIKVKLSNALSRNLFDYLINVISALLVISLSLIFNYIGFCVCLTFQIYFIFFSSTMVWIRDGQSIKLFEHDVQLIDNRTNT